jgi:phosphoribosyl 1,2-cyclic phosphodiesterase
MTQLTFYGVRGSTPSFAARNHRYGGNTASVVLTERDEEPILFDLGTGVRPYGATCRMDGSFAGTALVTHIHWDHVQGLPFFAPVHVAGARLDVYGPHQKEGPLAEVMDDLMRPPYFPVRAGDLAGEIRFHDVTADAFAIGSRKVTVRPVPHVGPTVGYRVENSHASVTYISDHQAPRTLDTIADGVLELADGVDVLIHDSQYTGEEFERKCDWGHCTIEYALRVAVAARAKRLVMFHHDPSHTDEDIDELAKALQQVTDEVEVLAAYEGMIIDI